MVTYDGPRRFAHRGMVQSAPENTLGAFTAAIEYGCEGIELDLRMSRDGEVIVAHDGNFTRMTLGHPTDFTTRRLSDMTWEEIRKVKLPYANHLLDVIPPKGVENEVLAILPERVMGQEMDYVEALSKDGREGALMRFSDFDKWFASCEKDVTIELEVKDSGIAAWMASYLRTSPNTGRYIIFSGVPGYIEEIQSFCGGPNKPEGLRLGANMRSLTEDVKKQIEGMDLFEIGLNAGCFTKEDIQWLKERGIVALSNLGDYPAWWQEMVQLGVWGFKTNYAQAYTEWWSKTADHHPKF